MIHRTTVALVELHSEIVEREPVAGHPSLLEPFAGLAIVHDPAGTGLIQPAEGIHAEIVPRRSRFLEPLLGLAEVLLHTLPELVEDAHAVHARAVVCCGRLFEPLAGPGVVHGSP